MRVYQFLILFVLVTTIYPTVTYYRLHYTLSAIHIALTFYLGLNSLICTWEIALGLYITKIAADYQQLLKKYEKKRLNAVVDFMLHDLSLSEAFSLRFWSRIWSTYSLYDPSYSNRESLGFFIDVGNGWVTIVPTLLFLYSLTYHDTSIVTARVMGMIGLVKFYQEFYGTCVYFLSFILNERYKGRTVFEVALFVGLTNGIWFVFPLLGMYVSYEMISNDSFSVLLQQ